MKAVNGKQALLLTPIVIALGLSLSACNRTVSSHGAGPPAPLSAVQPAKPATIKPVSSSTYCAAAHFWVIAVNGYIDSTGDLSTNLHTYVPAESSAMAKMATLAPAAIKRANRAYAATLNQVAKDYASIDYQVVPDSEASATAQMAALQDITAAEAATQAQQTQVVNYVRTVCGETIESDPNAK